MPDKTEVKSKFLKCVLNDEEIREKGQSLARAEQEREQNEAAKKAANEQFKSVDSALFSTIKSLTTEINNKCEYRYVEISEMPDYERNVMEIMRRDTGEKIDQRALTVDELQQKFNFNDSKKAVKEFADKLKEGDSVTFEGAGKKVTLHGKGKGQQPSAGD